MRIDSLGEVVNSKAVLLYYLPFLTVCQESMENCATCRSFNQCLTCDEGMGVDMNGSACIRMCTHGLSTIDQCIENAFCLRL